MGIVSSLMYEGKDYHNIKTERVLIDDEENRIEENILNTYISVVGDFIKSRKKKISL